MSEYVITSKMWSEYQKDLFGLRTKLDADERKIFELNETIASQENLILDLSSENEGNKKLAFSISSKRDDLQKQVAGMRDAFEKVMVKFCEHFHDRKNHSTICDPPDSDGCAMYDLCVGIEKSLSTPPTAYEQRVNGMVDALEKLARLGGPCGGYGNSTGNVIAQQAIVAFKGGNEHV